MNSFSQEITINDLLDAVKRMEELKRFEELREEEAIRNAVLVCNRENKYKLKQAIPELCIIGSDMCDEKIYMVTDKELAEQMRRYLIE